jgi:hypothetical protein
MCALFFPVLLHAQAISPVRPRTAYFSVGGFYSLAQMDYGQYHSEGFGGFADLSYGLLGRRLWVGPEGEARIIDLRLKSGVKFQNYLGGLRVSYPFRNFGIEPYVKGLYGGSRFHYPTFISNQYYDYTTYAIGGGVDLRLSNHIYWRAVDFEDQHFTNYPPYGLTPWAASSGLSSRFY